MSSSAALWCTWEPTVVIFGAYMALEPHYSQIMPPPISKVTAGSAAMPIFNSTQLHFPRFLAFLSALFRV